MGKSSNLLLKNMYESAVAFDDDTYLDIVNEKFKKNKYKESSEEVTKETRIKKAKKEEPKSKKDSNKPTSLVISEVQVKSTCNKCKEVIYGDLINMIYHPEGDCINPLFMYSCSKCGHSGRRSDYSKSMKVNEFFKFYKL